MRITRVVVVCVLATLIAAPGLWGQTQITTGAIQGTVSDQSGAVVPGAAVTVKNAATNLERSLNTDEAGRFVFLQLPPGRYTLRASKTGFATLVQEEFQLTVGQTITFSLTLNVSARAEEVVVKATPVVDIARIESSTTLDETAVTTTPVLGRKFEDLFSLTPGVAITQGPDGDEINFNGQRGISNNISLDGGDYNNGFFGEQLGGQRPVIDITMEAVKEFQVIATGGTAEFGRTAGGVVNVITKSGTNELHGSLFWFQRHRTLSADSSDGEPLRGFHREQFGGTVGGPFVKDKSFGFFAIEQIFADLTRPNLSRQIGSTACPQTSFTTGNLADETVIGGNPDCQRLALLEFYRTNLSQEEGLPVKRPVRNTSMLGRWDLNINPKNQMAVSYSFDYSRNENQTFDAATYGTSANGTEGPSKIHALNFNLFSTISPTQANEAHFTYVRELRPRAATPSNVLADTGIGFDPSFRFGNPFFLQPNIDETFWRTQIRDSYSIVYGAHTVKFGGEWIHSVNDQVFRGFFTGRYLFDSVVGFLRYSAPTAAGGFGPSTAACTDGTFATLFGANGIDEGGGGDDETCGSGFTGGPLLFYLQDGIPSGISGVPAPGASNISNEDYALYIQDKWQVRPWFILNYGLRWEAQIFPNPVVAPADTAYGVFLSNPLFPSDGTLHDQKGEFQPRIGFSWDVSKKGKSVIRASYNTYYARQNMLTQVGSITTNGAQQQVNFVSTDLIEFLRSIAVPPPTPPTYPGLAPVPPPGGCAGPPVSSFPCFTGVRMFSKNYHNPRIYTANVAFEHEFYPNWAFFVDFTWSKGVHLTRFRNDNFDDKWAPDLDPFTVFVAESSAKSLYRGLTLGMRKRFSDNFSLEWNYVFSKDKDDDSNERDPFTDRIFDHNDYSKDYSLADRDIRHRFNLFSYIELPRAFELTLRAQARSAQPITPVDPTTFTRCTAGTPPDCAGGVDLGRNSIRKNNQYFSLDWRLARPFSIGDRAKIIPMIEMFNTFNNDNNINPLTTPILFNFDGFLRSGVGDPLQVQFAVKLLF